jgi:hypothetical protein
MILRFEAWLVEQQYREDFVGDLARTLDRQDAIQKSSRYKNDEHKNWADIVVRNAAPEYIFAFNEAWQEFLRAKQAAKES